MLVERRGSCFARRLAVAATSLEARRLAKRLEHEVEDVLRGRTFYLDGKTYVLWRRKGKIAAPTP
jgi:hypothetical protein